MNDKKHQILIDNIASECIAVRIRIINRVITNIYDDALRPFGLKVSQMNILVATSKMKTARPADICKIFHLDVSTLSRNVERMKDKGWLEIVPDDDGRAQPFRLSLKGRKLLENSSDAWAEAQEKTKNLLGDGIVSQLNKAVQRIRIDSA